MKRKQRAARNKWMRHMMKDARIQTIRELSRYFSLSCSQVRRIIGGTK